MLAIRRCASVRLSAELRLACSCPSPSVGCLSRADQNGEVGFAPLLNRPCKAQRRVQRGDRHELALPRNYNSGARGTGSSNPLCSSGESGELSVPKRRSPICRSDTSTLGPRGAVAAHA
jgi:hypothetical protein